MRKGERRGSNSRDQKAPKVMYSGGHRYEKDDVSKHRHKSPRNSEPPSDLIAIGHECNGKIGYSPLYSDILTPLER